jgi:hypothetical protein
MPAMMEAAKKEPAQQGQSDGLPVGDNAKVKDDRHQPVPEPHHNGAEKEGEGRKSNDSKDYPSDAMPAISAAVHVFISVFSCFHVVYF